MLCAKSFFQSSQSCSSEEQEPEFANPTKCLGTLRQLDTAVVAKRNLATFLYQELVLQLQVSQEEGFKSSGTVGLCGLLAHSMDEVWEFIQK